MKFYFIQARIMIKSCLSYPRQELDAEAGQLHPDEPPYLRLPLLVLYRADHELVEHGPHLNPDQLGRLWVLLAVKADQDQTVGGEPDQGHP